VPFEVKVESEKLLKQFEDMQKRVTELNEKLPDVFLDWQREDMNRKYPKVDEHSGLSVTTLVYPRSRKKRPSKPGGSKAPKAKRVRRVAGTNNANRVGRAAILSLITSARWSPPRV